MGKSANLHDRRCAQYMQTLIMSGELPANAYTVLGEMGSSFSKRMRRMTGRSTYSSSFSAVDSGRYSDITLLARHGRGSMSAYSLTQSALRAGIVSEYGMDSYFDLYARQNSAKGSKKRKVNLRIANAVLASARAGVRVFPSEKPVPGLDLKKDQRFVRPESSFFYTTREIVREMTEFRNDAVNLAYGQAAGLFISSSGRSYPVYTAERRRPVLFPESETRFARVCESFLRRRGEGGREAKIRSAVWLAPGYTALKPILSDPSKDVNKIFLELYSGGQYFINRREPILALMNLTEDAYLGALRKCLGASFDSLSPAAPPYNRLLNWELPAEEKEAGGQVYYYEQELIFDAVRLRIDQLLKLVIHCAGSGSFRFSVVCTDGARKIFESMPWVNNIYLCDPSEIALCASGGMCL